MNRIMGRRTLRDDIERMKQENKSDNSIRRKKSRWIRLLFSLVFLAAVYYLTGIYYTALAILLILLFQCLLSKHRFRKMKCAKSLKQQELMIRTTSELILVMYLIVLGMVFMFYGCTNYILHIPMFQLKLAQWLQYSAMVFLFFEVIVLQFYRKIEREVGKK